MTTTSSAAGRPTRLVDREFRPGELPPADAPPVEAASGLETLVEREPGRRWPAKLAAWSAGLLLLLVIGNGVVSFARRAVGEGSVVDLALLAVSVVLLGSVAWLVAGQVRAYRGLKSAERARDMAAHLSKLGGAGSGTRLVAVLERTYANNPGVLGKLRAASAALQPHHTDRDVVDLLNREIFVPMDRLADEHIQRAALRAGIGVSACPHPALDALVVLGIGIGLVRDLMRVYGLRHSGRALYRIFSHVLLSASSAAVMSTVVEFAMRAAHDRLAVAVAGTAGEALVVARRMFMLGALAKAEIRPLPAP